MAHVEYWVVKLSFHSPAHFGDGGTENEVSASWVHSDTVWGALIATWFRFGLDREYDLAGRLDGPGPFPFAISSAFPYVGDRLYLPRPRGIGNQGLSGERKLAKETALLPLPLFAAWTAGRQVPADDVKEANRALSERIRTEMRARVVLDRVSHRSRIFHSAYTTFAPEAGLWFLLRLSEPNLQPLLERAVARLGEEGLGGDRSIGAGAFSASWMRIAGTEPGWAELLRPAGAGDRYCLLSLCNPVESEREALFTADSVLEVIERKGWSQTRGGQQCFRSPVRMLAEGSLLGAEPTGRVVDVRPEALKQTLAHPIWRSGIALAVPVAAKEAAQ